VLQVPLPVEPRKRFVYNVHCPSGPGTNVQHLSIDDIKAGLGKLFWPLDQHFHAKIYLKLDFS